MGIKERRAREKTYRKQEILNTAKKVFMEKGISLTRLEDIAERAELSPATIYLYFKNKEELYASLNLDTLNFIYVKLMNISKNKKIGPAEKLIKVKNAFYKTFQNDPLILRNIIRVQLEDGLTTLSPGLLSQINSSTKRTMNAIAEIYEQGVVEGVFRKEKGIGVADMLWGTFTGLMVYEEAKKKIDPRKNYFKATLDRAFNIIFRGLQRT